MKHLIRYRWPLFNGLLLAVLLLVMGVQVSVNTGTESKLGDSEIVFTLGNPAALAAGTVDYPLDGVDDNVQFQQALDALPATGGRLVVVSTDQINFSLTVTRAIANVTVEGTGAGSYFVNDGATPLFTAGGNNWVFSNLRTDAGSLNMGATTNWMWTNVIIERTYYAYRSPYGNSVVYDLEVTGNLTAETGRAATYVVAASDAPAHVKAQADVVCDGTADEVEINAALAASAGGVVKLSEGTFTTANAQSILIPSNTILEGSGWGTVIVAGAGASGAPVVINTDTVGGNQGIIIRNLTIDGNDANVGDYTPGVTFRKVTGGLVENTVVHNSHNEWGPPKRRGWGIGMAESSNITIRNNRSYDNMVGISIRRSNNILVDGNYSWGNDNEGIIIGNEDGTTGQESYRISVINNRIWDNLNQEGVLVEDNAASGGNLMSDIIIANNQLWNNQRGVLFVANNNVKAFSNSAVLGNIINTTTTYEGIGSSYLGGLLIANNEIISSAQNGIWIRYSDNNTISTNKISSSAQNSIQLQYSNYTQLINNDCLNSSQTSITFTNSTYINVRGNSVRNTTTFHGISAGGSNSNITIDSNSIINAKVHGIGTNTTDSYISVLGNKIIASGNNGINNLSSNTIIKNNNVQSTVSYSIYSEYPAFITQNDILTETAGIRLESGASQSIVNNNNITNNSTSATSHHAIDLNGADYVNIAANKVVSVNYASSQGFHSSVRIRSGSNYNRVLDNYIQFGSRKGAGTEVYNEGTDNYFQNNTGYIGLGEIRTYSGTIANLAQNSYNSLDNPFGQTVRVLSLNIYVSTNATATTPNIDCGIGSSATTDYTTLFDDLPGETIGFYNSLIATPGTQTVPQLWASGSGNRYLNMSIKDAAATGMVATYTVTVMGN